MKILLLGITCLLLVVSVSHSETFTWTNTTTLSDNTNIASTDQVKIITHLLVQPPSVTTWTEFASVDNGIQRWVGNLVSPRGIAYKYTITNELNGLISQQAVPVTYTKPFIATNEPSSLNIQP
jgi:hypothetical protein